MATTDIYSICGALQPTKRGMRFLGGDVDDGIQVDASAAAIVAGNHTIGTFSAWIMVPDNTGTYCIWGTGDANAVEYTTVDVEAGTIKVMMVKATPTTMIDVNTAANTITPHTWHHIAVVQDADIMKIYIDGALQTLTWTTATNTAQWFSDLNNIDGAHIGAADSVAGGGLLTEEFKGYISDVRIWSGTTAIHALSEESIKRVMSGQTIGDGVTIGYALNSWSLNGTLADAGSGADNGTLVGAVIYADGNEFASRLSFSSTVIAASNVSITSDDGVGYAVIVLSA